ncbi:MAG TPA: rhodanese-like domain-containing protein [Desulfobulbus sp.]|nr:rhodanese-like domain-containing protein [Desulfobulbus sp.]
MIRKKFPLTLLLFLLVPVLGNSCREAYGASRQNGATSGGKSISRINDESRLLVEADADFTKGKYQKAVNSLRSLLPPAADKEILWPRYKQAVLARVGNSFLHAMPTDRYSINMPAFVCALDKGADGYFLLDVREKREYASGHVTGAVNIPFREVADHLDQLPKPETGKKIIIICQTQHRANHVLVVLRELGFSNAYTLHHGYRSYLSFQKKLRNKILTKPTCGPTVAARSGTTPPDGQPLSQIPVPDHHDVAQGAAEQALQVGRSALAVDLLKLALAKEADKTFLWKQFDRALIAETGKTYLHSVPDSRYRVSIDAFVNHSQKKDRRYFLVDVRSPVEFTRGHLTGSVNIPFRTLLQHLDQLPKRDTSTRILLISTSQRRSIYNLVLLRQLGYKNSFMLKGGYSGYLKWLKKLPSLQGTSVPSLQGGTAPEGTEQEEEDFGC